MKRGGRFYSGDGGLTLGARSMLAMMTITMRTDSIVVGLIVRPLVRRTCVIDNRDLSKRACLRCTCRSIQCAPKHNDQHQEQCGQRSEV